MLGGCCGCWRSRRRWRWRWRCCPAGQPTTTSVRCPVVLGPSGTPCWLGAQLEQQRWAGRGDWRRTGGGREGGPPQTSRMCRYAQRSWPRYPLYQFLRGWYLRVSWAGRVPPHTRPPARTHTHTRAHTHTRTRTRSLAFARVLPPNHSPIVKRVLGPPPPILRSPLSPTSPIQTPTQKPPIQTATASLRNSARAFGEYLSLALHHCKAKVTAAASSPDGLPPGFSPCRPFFWPVLTSTVHCEPVCLGASCFNRVVFMAASSSFNRLAPLAPVLAKVNTLTSARASQTTVPSPSSLRR